MAERWRFYAVVDIPGQPTKRVGCKDIPQCDEVMNADLVVAGSEGRIERKRGGKFETVREYYHARGEVRQKVPDVREDWALGVESKVRSAFKKHAGVPTFRIPAKTIDANVKSSFLPPGRKTGARPPDPFVVLVFTEDGNFRDPASSPDLWRYFDRVAETLRTDPLVEDAGWESINAAVQYVWINPLMVA